VFIEFDHDDQLVPGTLKKVAAAFEAGAGFVFSDVAVFNDDTLDSWGYHSSHGWETYDLRVYNRPFIATKCFPIAPRCLCEVYYAPDHVRCWSRKAYYSTGGHNPELSVGDDHDLICRTYLSGAKFTHIGGCGYLYRHHASNTVKARNKAIQTQQQINRRKYLHPLINEWCKREGLKQVDMSVSLETPWRAGEKLPFTDDSIGQLRVWDILQRVPPEHQVSFFNEAYRCLVPGGYLTIAVPSERGRYASQDPQHVTRFNMNSFLYYTEKNFAHNNPAIACRFQMVQQHEGYPGEDFQKYKMLVLFADLCALKGQRQPGPQNI
jgi:predicted SAM-dependent methyltransferase